MGMIDGAIIGGVIGAVGAGFVAWQQIKWQRKFLAAIDAGDRATAQRLLAKYCAPVKQGKTFPLTKVLPQRNRVLGLWLLGDPLGVRAELAQHTGSAAYLTNVHLFGVLAVATEPGADVAALVSEAENTAGRVTAESNRMQKLLRDYADLLARIGAGLTGRPVDEADAKKLHAKSFGEPLLTRVFILRLLVVVAERAGKPGLLLQGQLAQLTRKFAAPAAS